MVHMYEDPMYRLKCELYSGFVGAGQGRCWGLDAKYLAMGWRLS